MVEPPAGVADPLFEIVFPHCPTLAFIVVAPIAPTVPKRAHPNKGLDDVMEQPPPGLTSQPGSAVKDSGQLVDE